MAALEYAVDPGWRLLLADLGVKPAHVLRRAGLPEDMLSRASLRLSVEAYHRFWTSLEAEVDDPLFPIRLGEAISTEAFSPPLFAALCSPDLRTAVGRIADYKPLNAPMRLEISETDDAMHLTLVWLDAGQPPPLSLVALELVFFVRLARMATRSHVCPLEVVVPEALQPAADYAAWFGTTATIGNSTTLVFDCVDATRPFLTANEGMWSAFEPSLRQRLAELDEAATVQDRVRAALLEGLPAGQGSIDAVARKLAVSKRTLQRKLKQEGTAFQGVLQRTRETLARHYLHRTTLTVAEISFLLGFAEPNSFYRAFQEWTGNTPEGLRRGLRV